MNVVRQWMIKPFRGKFPLGTLALITAATMLLTSCNPTELTGTSARSNITNNSDGSLDGKAFIYRDSPRLAGPKYGPANPDMSLFTDRRIPELITDNTTLTTNCTFGFSTVSNCVHSRSNETQVQNLPRREDRTWIFPVASPEFYQVNAAYHNQLGINTFLESLYEYTMRLNNLNNIGFQAGIPRSTPRYLEANGSFWFRGVLNPDGRLFKNQFLTSFSQCNQDANASFSPAGPEICLGSFKVFPNFWFVQDPTVIYHELGHALVSIMMNLRNGQGLSSSMTAHPLRSNLGSYGYSEAGAINEGIADFYSFVINGRAHIGEWGLGRTAEQSRPMRESDPLHIAGVSATSEGRLSYPQYVLYDPNNPDKPFEDVHYAGQIISHYLVALTDSLREKCLSNVQPSIAHKESSSWVMMLLAETLSEIGDLNARGIDYGVPFSDTSLFFNNLDPSNSYVWAQHMNQPGFRRFFQVFAKNIYKFITGQPAGPMVTPNLAISGVCPLFTKTDSERLLDDYGLLLFRTYNNNGNSTKDPTKFYRHAIPSIPAQPLTPVVETNRRKSALVSKQLLELAKRDEQTPSAISYYIIDNRTDMQNLLQELLFKGFAVPLSSEVASVDYNNNNIKISPGEIVAIIPNLFNASNTTMAGVQLLATDWDHVHVTDTTTGNFKPCVIDTVTTVDQGGQATTPDQVTDNDVLRPNSCHANRYPDRNYQRLIKNTSTNLFPEQAAAPVCLVQLEEGNSTRWVSQNEFRRRQGLSLVDKDCLGFSTSTQTNSDFTFNPHECLVRFLPGANDAFFSKIDPQKNYFETVVKESEQKQFNTGNLLVMEINKWIPPGTKFRCRLRARFNNCSDCFNETTAPFDDFLDYEFNGPNPFKVINFDFEIND
jgi:hypothetical protein